MERLVSFRVSESTAVELVRDYRKAVELQLEALPHRNLAKVRDVASWLIVAVKQGHELPQGMVEAQAKQEESKQSKARRDEVAARQRDEEAHRIAYYNHLRSREKYVQKKHPERYKSFLEDSTARRTALEANPAHRGQVLKIHLRLFDDDESRLERFRDYFGEPTMDVWS